MKRPISPHLQIYNIFSKSMTSSMSILHRIAAIGLFIGIFYLVFWFLAVASGGEFYKCFYAFITSWFGELSIVGLVTCLIFYLVTEIRFLIFAAGYWLEKKQVMVSGWVFIMIFLCLTILSLLIIFKLV